MRLHLVLMTTLAAATASRSHERVEAPQLPHRMVDLKYGGPSGILRLDEHKKHQHSRVPDIDKQNRAVEETFSPAFLEKYWIVDFRLRPLIGKHQVISEGNHVLLLPKKHFGHRPHDAHRDIEDNREHHPIREVQNDHQRNEHDQILEFNRLKKLSRKNKDIERHREIHDDDDNDDDKEHASQRGRGKGYNQSQGWARLPDIVVASRNDH